MFFVNSWLIQKFVTWLARVVGAKRGGNGCLKGRNMKTEGSSTVLLKLTGCMQFAICWQQTHAPQQEHINFFFCDTNGSFHVSGKSYLQCTCTLPLTQHFAQVIISKKCWVRGGVGGGFPEMWNDS